MKITDPNRRALEQVARDLGHLRDDVVFVGGATVGLLTTDPAAPPIRPTKDVDVIIEVKTRAEYDHRIREALLQLGFRELMGEHIPICAWQKASIRLDIMPTAEELLGFSNRWYEAAVRHAQHVDLDDCSIRVVSAPYFLATKLEAFIGRGKGDFVGSHDLEDIIAVLDGRPGIVSEMASADEPVRAFVAAMFEKLLSDRAFQDALPGQVVDPGRDELVLDRMQAIAQRGSP